MKPTKILFYIALLALIPIMFSVLKGGKADHSVYISEIEKERKTKQTFMATDDESPFIEQSAPFTQLNYFDVDPDFQIKARFERLKTKELLTLATSDNKEKSYYKYATASFRKENETHELLLLKPTADEDYLFLAFTDETSAFTTYGAGRYLEVKEPKSGNTIVLDFNRAYNPYCAYVDGYSCPMPPKENHLGLKVKAGEKNYE